MTVALEAKQSPSDKTMGQESLSSHRAKPDLEMWAHQARQISG
jgi:hypothetical protein